MKVTIYSFIFFIFLALNLNANTQKIDNPFITTYEYGQMLYNNPRGIGCNKCHGDDAKGKILGKYTTKKKKIITVEAPDISEVDFDKFLEVLTIKSKKSLVMPTYFLTTEELKSLYYYIVNANKRKKELQ
jgi:hypothetical protein